MNLFFLPFGPWGVVSAALISFVGGCLVHGAVHLLVRRQHWLPAKEIGWAWLATIGATASVDSWNLFYMGIVPLESPATIGRVLASIHDPDTLGMRVTCEFIGASAGVMLGWLLWTGAGRVRHGSQPD